MALLNVLPETCWLKGDSAGETPAARGLEFVQKQMPDRRRISNKIILILPLSRPTGVGTARSVSGTF